MVQNLDYQLFCYHSNFIITTRILKSYLQWVGKNYDSSPALMISSYLIICWLAEFVRRTNVVTLLRLHMHHYQLSIKECTWCTKIPEWVSCHMMEREGHSRDTVTSRDILIWIRRKCVQLGMSAISLKCTIVSYQCV